MGKTDVTSKDYLGQADVFADAFNYYIYGGKRVLKPEELKPWDTTAISVPYNGAKSGAAVQRYRDILKLAVAMEDGKRAYLMLGIEAQSAVHYAIPVRNMLYDAIEYGRQVSEKSSAHRRAGDFKGRNNGEFLSGFYKGDQLLPVITLVVLLSPEKWDGPLSLHEMMGEQEKEVLSLVPDYRVNLLTPYDLDDGSLKLFQSSLREVLGFIKYSKDKKKLKQLLIENDRYRFLERKAVELLNSCTNIGICMEEEKEEEDMCQAWEEMRADARAEGKAEGRAEGKAEGRAEGKAEGRAEGRTEGKAEGFLRSLTNLMETMKWTAEQAMEALKIPEEDRAAYRDRLNM